MPPRASPTAKFDACGLHQANVLIVMSVRQIGYAGAKHLLSLVVQETTAQDRGKQSSGKLVLQS